MNEALNSTKNIKKGHRLRNLSDILTIKLQSIIKKFGLLLLTLPTGFGKTYYVILYIIFHIERNFPQRIWFATNLKKNLPIEELKEKLGVERYNKYVLFLDSYTDSAKLFFNEHQVEAPYPYNEWESYRALKKWAGLSKRSSKDKELRDSVYKELRSCESKFRYELKNHLAKGDFFHKTDTKEDRLLIIRDSEELRWIEQLYPSVAYFEKKVVLCSIDKFYGYIDTIIGPNIQITSPENIKENIVFIDEFDATKNNILNAIIKNAKGFNQDILGLFISVYRGISERGLPQDIISTFSPTETQSINRLFQNLNEIGTTIYKDFDFNSRFFYKSNDEYRRAFIFHDFQYHTIVNVNQKNNQKKYVTRKLTENKVNKIEIIAKKPLDEKENMLILLNRLRGYLNLFARLIAEFAKIYKAHHDSSQNNNDSTQIGFENAIRTCLALFDVNDRKVQDYFIDLISQKTNVNYRNIYGPFDQSPLNKGFRYYDIENKKSHDANTKINVADTLTTPETWLLNLCNNAKVVGISATAGFESPLSNYSLYHLRHHLGDHFYKLSEKEQKILEEEFQLKQELASNRKILTTPIKCKATKAEAFKEIFIEEEVQNSFLFDFKDIKEHEIRRYIKISKAYQYYLQNDDIYSFLCLLNKFPKKDSTDHFSKKKLFNILSQLRQIEFSETPEQANKFIKEEIVILRSEDYDDKIRQIKNDLEQGKKRFLISTYQTIGAGQNIQYRFNKDIPVIAIHKQPYGDGEKDFDAIYLEKPTHLLSHFSKGEEIKEEELLEYIFEIEYLFDSGVIDIKEKRARLEFIFKRKHNRFLSKPSNRDLQLAQVVLEHYCRILMQAVGRLSRSKYKNPITHILYDNDVKKFITAFNLTQKLVVPEFLALYKQCALPKLDKNKINRNSNSLKNKHNSLYLSRQIRELVMRIPNWNKKEIKFWNQLRQFVLKNPTISKNKLEKSGLLRFYIKAPNNQNRYYYSTKDDFKNNLQISFEERIGREVSSENIGLNQILALEGLQDFFEENDWATSFHPNDYIISPPLFKNIYLGALGEEIGKFLFEKHIPSIKLSELAIGEYELFDYKVNNRVYVDFKFWKERLNAR